MKIAIISDTHFGDRKSTLFHRDDNGNVVEGSRYGQFRDAAEKGNDYLILAGDIFDFSITSYKDSYEIARQFFFQIQKDKIANEIIYIPGNHDFSMWHTFEHQINVIYQIKKGRPPAYFRWSVPGIIDDRSKSANRKLILPDVSKRDDTSGYSYGGMFLDNITISNGVGKETNFNFVYPNLYLITDNEAVMMTHGHYLEPFWVLSSEWAMKILPEELNVGQVLSLKNLTAINFPTCQLTSSGVGQAGPLTEVIRKIQRHYKDKKLDLIKKYLRRLRIEIDIKIKLSWWKEIIESVCLKGMEKGILDLIENPESARYSKEFIHKSEVMLRFWNYYQSSMIEINSLNTKHSYDIPMPWVTIFGHTHRPIHWGDEDAPHTNPLGVTGGKPVTLYNTGGWLTKDDNKFYGAAVFKYETDKGFSSIIIE